MFLTQSLHRRAQGMPSMPFTICADRTTTNAEALDRVARMAGGLRGLGVRSDDRVGILDVNTDHFVLASFAVAWADAAVVPVNYRWSVKEMVYSLVEAGTEVVLVGDGFLDLVDALREAMPGGTTFVHIGNQVTPAAMVPPGRLLDAEPVPDAERGGDKLLGLFYTGGTTGVSKGVMLSHRGVMVSAFGSAASGGFPRRGNVLLVAPGFHLAGFATVVMAAIQDQGCVVVPEFLPTEVMRLIETHQVQQATLVPTMIQMILDHPDVDRYDLGSVEMIIYGASPISDTLLGRARTVFSGARFCQTYGMTELSPVTTMLLPEDHGHPVHRRSAGRVMPYSLVRVVDAEDNEVPRGTVGEIVVRGEHVMLGYWKQPETTAATLRNGWMHTGDGAYMDEDGFLYIVDRIKDMIISGGENVYSIEVENVIAKHSAVRQVAVLGVPDDVWGERVHAVVELNPGETLDLAQLRAFAKQEIAGYKCPQSLEVVSQWPLSAAGKILKRELRRARVSGSV